MAEARRFTPCNCGFNPYDRPDVEEFGHCPVTDALQNHVTFPSFRTLTDINNPSTTYYSGWETGKVRACQYWCFIGEIAQVMPPILRSKTLVQTKSGEEASIAWYLPDGKMPFDLRIGSTLCLLYAEKKTFLDMTVGIREESPEFCQVFHCGYEDLRKEAQNLLRNFNDKARHCFHCGKPTGTCCSKCKLASYCSVDCQKNAWGMHKKLCKEEAQVLALALLPFIDYDGQVAFRLLENRALKLMKEVFAEKAGS